MNTHLLKSVILFFCGIILQCIFSWCSVEITVITPTTRLEMEIDSQKFDDLTYIHLPTLLLRLDFQISFLDTKINISNGDTVIKMDLSSTIFTVMEPNATRLFQLSYPLKLYNETIWAEVRDVSSLLQEVFGYQVIFKDEELFQVSPPNEFSEISVPGSNASVQKSNEDDRQKPSGENENVSKSVCWRRILVVFGHCYSGVGLRFSQKLTEKDINKLLSLKIANILKSYGFDVKVVSETTNANLNQVKDYLVKENPDLVISIHLSNPSQNKPSANIFCSKVEDMKVNQILAEFSNELLRASQNNNLSIEKVYFCPLVLASIAGIPEILIEFIPNKTPDVNIPIEDIVQFKPLTEILGNSLKRISEENCK